MLHFPHPIAEPPSIKSPEDVAYPGTIRVEVDATDVLRGIFQVVEQIPVPEGGDLTLLYPKWLPGYHSPQAPIENLAGLRIFAGGEELKWRRDPVEVYAFHLDVPEGIGSIEARFQFLSPTSPGQGRVVATPAMLNLQWNAVVLYPAGHYARRIEVEASVELPEGWQFGTALEVASQDGAKAIFKPVPLDVLVDSPIFAGCHFHQYDLDSSGSVRLNIVADQPDLLAATPEQIAPHRSLVEQADRLFGTRPFDRYEFLVALSDELGGIGVEHHRCCEIGTETNYLTAWGSTFTKRDVMAHEYVHSWNGKFRRGEDSWIPSFERPIRNSLMWVYEGQTQYWGQILAARSGLWSKQNALDALAQTAATYDIRAGRRWRPMSDTTRDPIIASRGPQPWTSWQRSEDYYSEGQLLWLEIDTLIRELSGDVESLDRFARTFFGTGDGTIVTQTYSFDDVVQALQEIVPFAWREFLRDSLERTGGGAPLGGLERGGYRLVYRDYPNEFAASANASANLLDLTFSIGLSVSADGTIQEVIWESPAFDARITSGSSIVGVNGLAYGAEELRQSIIRAQEEGCGIELLVKNGKRCRITKVEYFGRLAYPHLAPIEGARLRLDEILARL